MEIQKSSKGTHMAWATTAVVLTAASFWTGSLRQETHSKDITSQTLYESGLKYANNSNKAGTSAMAEQLRALGHPEACADLSLRVDNKELATGCVKDLMDRKWFKKTAKDKGFTLPSFEK